MELFYHKLELKITPIFCKITKEKSKKTIIFPKKGIKDKKLNTVNKARYITSNIIDPIMSPSTKGII